MATEFSFPVSEDSFLNDRKRRGHRTEQLIRTIDDLCMKSSGNPIPVAYRDFLNEYDQVMDAYGYTACIAYKGADIEISFVTDMDESWMLSNDNIPDGMLCIATSSGSSPAVFMDISPEYFGSIHIYAYDIENESIYDCEDESMRDFLIRNGIRVKDFHDLVKLVRPSPESGDITSFMQSSGDEIISSTRLETPATDFAEKIANRFLMASGHRIENLYFQFIKDFRSHPMFISLSLEWNDSREYDLVMFMSDNASETDFSLDAQGMKIGVIGHDMELCMGTSEHNRHHIFIHKNGLP